MGFSPQVLDKKTDPREKEGVGGGDTAHDLAPMQEMPQYSAYEQDEQYV